MVVFMSCALVQLSEYPGKERALLSGATIAKISFLWRVRLVRPWGIRWAAQTIRESFQIRGVARKAPAKVIWASGGDAFQMSSAGGGLEWEPGEMISHGWNIEPPNKKSLKEGVHGINEQTIAPCASTKIRAGRWMSGWMLRVLRASKGYFQGEGWFYGPRLKSSTCVCVVREETGKGMEKGLTCRALQLFLHSSLDGKSSWRGRGTHTLVMSSAWKHHDILKMWTQGDRRVEFYVKVNLYSPT